MPALPILSQRGTCCLYHRCTTALGGQQHWLAEGQGALGGSTRCTFSSAGQDPLRGSSEPASSSSEETSVTAEHRPGQSKARRPQTAPRSLPRPPQWGTAPPGGLSQQLEQLCKQPHSSSSEEQHGTAALGSHRSQAATGLVWGVV